MRPDWNTYFLRLAYLTATRASCDRKHVGAILVSSDHRVVSMGYNGAPAGMADCDTIGHELVEGHCHRTIHAESNAIDYAGRLARDCTLYTTVSPCYDCAKRIVNAGISHVVYDEFYSSRYGKSAEVPEFLKSGGVVVEQFDSPGLQLFKTHLVEMERAERIVAETTQVEWACGCQALGVVAGRFCPMHGQPRVHE
jgi:dCMP deaminase